MIASVKSRLKGLRYRSIGVSDRFFASSVTSTVTMRTVRATSAQGTSAPRVVWGRREKGRPRRMRMARGTHGRPASPPVAAVLGRMGCWRVGLRSESALAGATERRRSWRWRWRRCCRRLCSRPNSTESAVANGDTRTIILSNDHTNEFGSFTYMVNGVYDQAVLDKLNWFLSRLAAQRADEDGPPPVRHRLGGLSRIRVDAADRRSLRLPFAADQRDAAPALAAGRRAFRSTWKARRSTRISSTSAPRASATSPCACRRAASASTRPASTPWVHIDSGSVRYWPRMSRDALARLVP